MSELFVNTIANSCAGMALFSLPDAYNSSDSETYNGSYTNVVAFLAEDPTISMKNSWDAIIPDATSLSDFSQLSGMGAVSWLSTSKAAWKGTDPITLNLTFYLLTYRTAQIAGTATKQEDPRNMPVTEQAARFAGLLAVSPKTSEQGTGGGKFAQYGINVHGGYRANYFEPNTDFRGDQENEASEERYSRFLSNIEEQAFLDDADGTIQIIINGGGKPTMYFTKMLLADATFTPSPVRVGYWRTNSNGTREFVKSSEPLYIKVSATFRMSHVATVKDAVRMFRGVSKL